jgi:NADH-quinone oxidoreductase subunit N
VKANSGALAVVAMVTAVIAAFFYLRVILLMYSSSVGLTAAGDGLSAATGSGAGAGSGAGGTTALATTEAPAVAVVEGESAGGEREPVAPSVVAAIAICVVVTVLFGLWPAPIVNFAHHALLYAKSPG